MVILLSADTHEPYRLSKVSERISTKYRRFSYENSQLYLGHVHNISTFTTLQSTRTVEESLHLFKRLIFHKYAMNSFLTIPAINQYSETKGPNSFSVHYGHCTNTNITLYRPQYINYFCLRTQKDTYYSQRRKHNVLIAGAI